MAGIWAVLLHTTVNYLNSKREHLFLYWLKLTYEVKPKNGDHYKIVNFVRNSEDEQFFQGAAQINYKISESLRYFTYFGSVFMCRPYFYLEGTQLDLVTFWFFASVNCLLFGIFFLKFTKIMSTLNLFPIVMLRYFSRRCKHILDQIKTLKNASSDIDNVKLNEILFDFNSLMLQMANVNGYWKFFFGEPLSTFPGKKLLKLSFINFQASTFWVYRRFRLSWSF